MRSTLRLLQAAHVAPYTPTGITGILTHPLPRATLISIYSQTLDALAELPPTSVYRTSTENLTKKRLSVVESVKPWGYEEYQKEVERIKKKYGLEDEKKLNIGIKAAQLRAILAECRDEAHPENDVAELDHIEREDKMWQDALKRAVYGDMNGSILPDETLDQANSIGNRHEAEPASPPPSGKVTHSDSLSKADKDRMYEGLQQLPREPPLSHNQINKIESEIGAGLIEELIQQGERELQLARQMKEFKPWEDLEVVAPEGQWVYNERA